MHNEENLQDELISGRSLISQIRTAFAFQDQLYLRVNNQNHIHDLKTRIVSFDDGNLRDVNIQRRIELLLLGDLPFEEFKSGDQVTLVITNKRLITEIPCETFEKRGDSIFLILPKEGKQKITRVSARVVLENENWSDALLKNEQCEISCVFKINDFSESGIGVSLITSVDLFKHGTNFTLQGNIRTEKFEFNGPYPVIRLHRVQEGKDNFVFDAGLENSWPVEETPQRASRFTSELFLNILIRSSGVRIQVSVMDVSISGFKSEVSNKYLANFSRGVIVEDELSSLNFVVVRKVGNEVGFKLISEHVSDRIKWVNKIIPTIERGSIETSVNDPRELLDLFFEAGATVADGLNYNRLSLTKNDSLSVLTEQSESIIRWINISDQGTLLAHHSTYRVGLNSWYTGDVVGGQNDKNRAQKEFFNNNFKFLKEIFESFHSCQKILGSWKPDHPYWQDWRNYLIGNNFLYSRLMCDTVSRRQIKNLISIEQFEKFSAKIFQIDGKEIFDIIGCLDDNVKWLLGSLDISQTGQYFDGLSYAYSRSLKSTVKKECRVINFLHSKYFVLFCQLPDGITINPNFDTAFIFPVQDSPLKQEVLDNLYTFIMINASKLGFRLATVRYFSKFNSPIGIHTEFFVTDSRGLGVFG